MSRRRLVSKDVSALAMGATLLGSGGGGGTDLGARILVKALGDRSVELVAAGDLPDDVVIVHAGLAGSPDVYAERLIDPQDLVRAIQAVVDAVGQPLGAIGILEIGGINALLAPAAAALLGVPLVDGDLMGRTYPTLLFNTYAVLGRASRVGAVVGPLADTALFRPSSPAMEARFNQHCARAFGVPRRRLTTQSPRRISPSLASRAA